MNSASGAGSLLPLLVIILLLWITTDSFMQFDNIMQVLRQASVYALMGIGMTFVIITGGIDLSQGSSLALSCVCAGLTINATGNMWLGIGAALAAGAVIGLYNGVLVAYVKNSAVYCHAGFTVHCACIGPVDDKFNTGSDLTRKF